MTADNPKHPFMPIRDAAGSFKLDDPSDGTPISDMLSLDGRLLLITEKSTYEVKLADQIDPERKNPNLPHNVRRKILDYGVNSGALQKTVLQANALFRDGFLKIDIKSGMALAVEALEQYAAIERSTTEFEALQNAAIERFARIDQQPRSVGLPSIEHIDSHCRTFAQRAHIFGKTTLRIAKLFYPTASNWDKLLEITEAKYGRDDQFTKLATGIKPTMLLVLNMRDSLEHQLPGAVVRDFSMEVDGTVAPPTIEVNFRKSRVPRCSVLSLMQEISAFLLTCFQMMIVHMSSKSVQTVAGMQTQVIELPEANQKARHIKFGYGVIGADGHLAPLLG
jgi:hypothetical protein